MTKKIKKKRCAMVGIGHRAHSWLQGITVQHTESSELVGLCDINLERCCDVNLSYGTNAAVYTDYDLMLSELQPDLVIVTSPEGVHLEHIVKALDTGSNVATEKPLCTNLEDAKKIIEAEKRNNKKIFMAFNYRHIPLMSKIKEQILHGAIGKPVSMDLTWYLDYKGHGASYFRRWHRLMQESGGLLVTKACHHFDLANWWMGDNPEKIYANGTRNFFGSGNNQYQGRRCLDCKHASKCEWYTDVSIKNKSKQLSKELGYQVTDVRGYIRDYCPFGDDVDIYDTMSVNVQYQNGGLLTYSLNASAPYEGFDLAINGTEGRLESGINDNKPSPGWQQKFRIIDTEGKYLKGKGYRVTDWPTEYSIHIMPHDRDDYEIRPPNIIEGHGGGDYKIFDAVLADIYPETDELGIYASAIHGAYSTSIGAAANESIASGLPVVIDDLSGENASNALTGGQNMEQNDRLEKIRIFFKENNF